MSSEAARIIQKISNRKPKEKNIFLGIIKETSPLTLKLDDIAFDITSGLLLNSTLLEHRKTGIIQTQEQTFCDVKINVDSSLEVGDRVVAVKLSNACYIILAKVVKR